MEGKSDDRKSIKRKEGVKRKSKERKEDAGNKRKKSELEKEIRE